MFLGIPVVILIYLQLMCRWLVVFSPFFENQEIGPPMPFRFLDL